DAVERLVPRNVAPGVVPARVAHARAQHPERIVDDLARGLTANTQEAVTVGVVGIAPDAQHAIVLDRDFHPAERRVAVHPAHRLDAAALAHRISLGEEALLRQKLSGFFA